MTKLHQKKSQNNQQKKQIVERIAYPHPSCRKCFKICTISAPLRDENCALYQLSITKALQSKYNKLSVVIILK